MVIKIGNKIRELREHVGFSQQRLSELLGVLRPTVSQIEKGERRISADELKKLSEIFGVSMENLLDLEKIPEVILEEGKVRQKAKPLIRINVPQKNLEKFRAVFLYILNKVGSKPNIGETVIYKLLYFIDFDLKAESSLPGTLFTLHSTRREQSTLERMPLPRLLFIDEKILTQESFRNGFKRLHAEGYKGF